MGWPRLKCLGPGSIHPTSLSYSYAPLDQLALRIARPLLLAALFTRAMLNPAQVARFPLASHNFHLLIIFPTLPHLCAPRNTHPLLNAKPSARSIAHRSSSADAIPPLCDILPLRLCALSVGCAGVRTLPLRSKL